MINIGKVQKGICRFTILFLKFEIYEDIDFLRKGVVTHVTWTCVQLFLLCDCDLKKARWNANPNGWFVTLDVMSKKWQRRKWLIIMNNRQIAFYFLLFFNFLVLFVIYRLWSLVCVLYGVPTLRSNIGDGMFVLWFSFMEWRRWCWRMDNALEVGGWR